MLAGDRSGVLNIPTGGGKSHLAGRAIDNARRAGAIAIYLCPLRAIAREIHGKWSRDPAFAGATIGLFTGETGIDDGTAPLSPSGCDVVIATPEKFDFWLRQWQHNIVWLARVGLVVADELHTLGEGRRGATLEGVLTRLRAVNPFAATLGLSATLGNPEELAEWLDGKAFVSHERAVPVDWQIATFKASAQAQASKARLVCEVVQEALAGGGQCIVFVMSRPRADALAAALRESGVAAESHHAGHSRTARARVEQAFRDGHTPVIVATPTLAAGVNLPARTVVLADLQRFDRGEWRDLPVNEVLQLAGRAGRPGLDDRAQIILLSAQHNQTAARRYLAGRCEPIGSAWQGALFAEQVMTVIGSGLARTADQAIRTLGRSLHARTNARLAADCIAMIDRMLEAEMLERSEDHLRATSLGRTAVQHQFTPTSVLAVAKLARESAVPQMSVLDWLIVAAALPDFTARPRIPEDRLDAIAESWNGTPSNLRGRPAADLCASLAQSEGREVVAAVAAALALAHWADTGDADEAASIAGMDAHEFDELRKEMVRALAAIAAILHAVAPDDGPLPEEPSPRERVQALSAMVTTGLGARAATLALLDGIGPVLSRRLISAGIEDIEDLAAADSEEISAIDGISARRAADWISAASELIQHGGAYRYAEIQSQAQRIDAGVGGVEVMRWQRAKNLVVERLDEGGWRVSGGAEPHHVRAEEGGYACDCPDAARHQRWCKHEIAVRHLLNDPDVPRFDAPFTPAAGNSLSAIANFRRHP
jgi:helicase